MLLTAFAAVALAAPAPPDGIYRGTTAERLPVRISVRDGRVAKTVVRIGRYVCVPEGDVAPLAVTVRPSAPIGADRRFSFAAGTMPESLRMSGTFGARGTLRGRLQAYGTIGTGDPCRSPTLRFTARRQSDG